MLLDDGKLKKEILADIGKRLRDLRKQAGYTVAEMCGFLNTMETHYMGIENGDYFMSSDRLITIKDIFGIELNWLICGEESEPGDTVMYHETSWGES